MGFDATLMPSIGPELLAAVRVLYGALMLLTLVAALPHWRRYFVTERWGGYTESKPLTDVLQHPAMAAVWLLLWIGAAIALVAGRFVMPAAAVNLLFCYYFFNRLRWTSLSRGMGAPGFIALWLGAAVFLLELTARHAAQLQPLALLTLQIDFGLIMLTAGLYKLAAGYRAHNGMELGMANPEWGYWPSFWKQWPPRHALFRFLNEMAWGTEVACGAMMLIPATRLLGGAGILLSFIFIATQIRLGFLSEMVIVCCLLFFAPGTIADRWIADAWHTFGGPIAVAGAPLPSSVQTAITIALWVYLILLPFVRAGMFYNQLLHRSWPPPVQRLLDAYANLFGLILWRVFTADVVNFFVRVWEQPATGARRLISHFESVGTRFSQVAECIALTSVFTTLKYFPSNREMFERKLLRYARTIPRERSSQLVFEWVHMTAREDSFEYQPVAEFAVDPEAGTVSETELTTAVSVRAAAGSSPVHEGVRPGSYAPRPAGGGARER